MKKLTRKKKNYLSRRSRKEERKRKKRGSNFRRKRIEQAYQLRSRKYLIEKEKSPEVFTLKPNPRFSLRQNYNNVIDFINTLKKYRKAKYQRRIIFIDLAEIVSIDTGAVCILLSVIEELTQYKIPVEGSIPNRDPARKHFVNSGFLAHMKSITGGLNESPKNKNLILKTGKDKTRNEEVGNCIKSAVEFIVGNKGHYNPIYSIIQEINGNSVEHAYHRNEHWILGLNYVENENKVIFTFADNGFGILNTLHKKLGQKFFAELGFSNDQEILKGAYIKKHGSRHQAQINRNKGLPLLKKIQDNGYVRNLSVVTNKVYYNLDTKESIKLNSEFSGTFYYWELDANCIDKWQQKKLA